MALSKKREKTTRPKYEFFQKPAPPLREKSLWMDVAPFKHFTVPSPGSCLLASKLTSLAL